MCECTCLYVFNFVSVYMCEIAVSESFEPVLCCLDVASVVSNLSRFVSV